MSTVALHSVQARDTRHEQPVAGVSEVAWSAWQSSFLAALTPRAAGRLLSRSAEEHLSAGRILWPKMAPHASEMESPRDLFLVIDGLLRTYRQSDVRQVTIRYVGAGEVFGVPAAIRGWTSATGQVISDCHALRLMPGLLRDAVREDTHNAWVITSAITELHEMAVELLCENVFQPVRRRVARHLLDLSVRRATGVIVDASHQEIADAVGSVREVISRTLRQLECDGLIERCGEGVLLHDLAGLHRAAG
jgi:CRP-like cAMP-binding protein